MLLQLRKAMQHTAREKLPCMQFRKQQNICVEISFQIRIQIHKIGVGKKKKLDKQKQNITRHDLVASNEEVFRPIGP